MGGTAFVIPIEEKYSRSLLQLIGVDNPISIHISEPFAHSWKGRHFVFTHVVSHRERKIMYGWVSASGSHRFATKNYITWQWLFHLMAGRAVRVIFLTFILQLLNDASFSLPVV